ncbi:hypothetical protein [Reinekea sp.]|jgi:hypothetical protein|uniref:hypothetical protein n=1 Tax=Reinekea sp. TaxID=1970455 RepID=UPI003988F8FD
MKPNRLTTKHLIAATLMCVIAVYSVVFAQTAVKAPTAKVEYGAISMGHEAMPLDHCQQSVNPQDCESCNDIHCPCGHIALPLLIDIAIFSGNEHSTAEPPKLKPIAYSMTLDRPPRV